MFKRSWQSYSGAETKFEFGAHFQKMALSYIWLCAKSKENKEKMERIGCENFRAYVYSGLGMVTLVTVQISVNERGRVPPRDKTDLQTNNRAIHCLLIQFIKKLLVGDVGHGNTTFQPDTQKRLVLRMILMNSSSEISPSPSRSASSIIS